VEHERRAHPRHLLQGVLERAPGVLDQAERLDQHGGVLGLERLAAPGAVTVGVADLLDEQLPPAVRAGGLDLHAISRAATRSTTLSASSNGSTGLTNQASAPDH